MQARRSDAPGLLFCAGAPAKYHVVAIQCLNRSKGNACVLDLMRLTLRQARKLVVAVIGTTVVLVGVVMLVTPGPAFVVIPIGLGILATEFVWARRLLIRVKEKTLATVEAVRKGR